MTPKYVVPKGTINILKTKHSLGLNNISHNFNEDFTSGEIRLKDCEILDENSIEGLVITVVYWCTTELIVNIVKDQPKKPEVWATRLNPWGE